VLRIIAGLMFMLHGTQKLFGVPGNRPPQAFGTLIWTAGVIELVCGALIAVGLLTTWAAFLASGQMAVAYFKSHAGRGTLPIMNGGELAVLYCFLFLYMAAQGSGILSLDSIMRRRR
jgi:putative oxidoreductase